MPVTCILPTSLFAAGSGVTSSEIAQRLLTPMIQHLYLSLSTGVESGGA